MASLSITKTYADGEVLLEADLDGLKTSIETFLNTTGINDDNIQNGGITGSSKLVDSSVTTAKINDDAVTNAKIADDAVQNENIEDTAIVGSVTHNGFVGEVRMFHTFSGTVAVPRGWMPLTGLAINQTNYDAQHGSGAYVADGVASSALDTKTLPNMQGKYAIGAAGTSQDGSSTITSIGNSGSTIDFSHTHTAPSHRHQWFQGTSSTGSGSDGSNDRSLDTNGSFVDFALYTDTASGSYITVGAQGSGSRSRLQGDYFTTNQSGGSTGSALSASQDIRPESIEFIYIMKVV